MRNYQALKKIELLFITHQAADLPVHILCIRFGMTISSLEKQKKLLMGEKMMKKTGFEMMVGMIAVAAFLLIPAMTCFASVETVPEPMSILLLGTGIAALVGMKKFFG